MGSTLTGFSDWSPNSTNSPITHPWWPQHPSPPPPFPGFPMPMNGSEKCLFRRMVLDECYQSRFWARALEFYLLDDELHYPPYRCLMGSCPQGDFKDSKSMLRHLKECKYFPQGKFYCPTCRQIESFKVVSKKKCSWDQVNWAHKVLQKSWKVLQRISGNRSLCPNCLRGMSPNGSTTTEAGSFDSSQFAQPKSPMPPTVFNTDFSQAGQVSSITPPWELSGSDMSSEISDMFRQLDYVKHQGLAQELPHNGGAPIPRNPSHQTSPSKLPLALFDQTAFSSNFSPPSANLRNESPVMGWNTPVIASSLPPASQESHRGEMPSLKVNTGQPVASISVPEFEYMLLDEGQTLSPNMGLDSQGMVDSNLGPIAPQSSEITPFGAPYGPNKVLIPHNSSHLHLSSPMTMSSSSNHDLSPSSVSSEPEYQCNYPGCSFKPSGKNKRAYFRKHLKTHDKNKIPCDHCNTTCSRLDNLTCHIRRIHPAIYDSVYKSRQDSSRSCQSSGQPRRNGSRREDK
ncbi:hypothetical protein F5Y10DRAFT_251577 [Nemania abortiva]|nr:hypothetical protein F5Y10DRAFT_251577 [Nemania abortiva]